MCWFFIGLLFLLQEETLPQQPLLKPIMSLLKRGTSSISREKATMTIFFIGASSFKETSVMKITLPYYGTTAGLGYMVMEIDNQVFFILSKVKICVGPSWLLEDNLQVVL